jgi:peptidyl-prolyl cis-trans isomerase B (cyclophilin B)
MARSANPDSAGSQFFICLGDESFLDGQYTAFGKVVKGEDVLKAIGNTPTERGSSGENSSPLERIEVTSVTVEK